MGLNRGRRAIVGAMRAIIGWGLVWILAAGGTPPVAAQSAAPPSVRFERLEGLSHSTVFAVLHGQRGFLWVGTADGLNRYDGYGFTVYRHVPSDSSSLSGNIVQDLAQDEQGFLWIGTAQGINRLNPETGTVVRYVLEPEGPTQNIAKVLVDGQGALWAWTYEEVRLYRLQPGADRFTRIALPHKPGTGRSAEAIANPPITDARGRVWMITSKADSCGLHRYEGRRDEWWEGAVFPCHTAGLGRSRSDTLWVDAAHAFERKASEDVESPTALAALPALPDGARLRQVLEDRAGRVWIGTDRGVYRYAPSTSALSYHRMEESGTPGLSNYVWAVHEDRAGILWVGTRSGLYRYDPHEHPFRHFEPYRVLANERRAIMAIHEGAQDQLYLGTLGGGLLRVRPREKRSANAPDASAPALHDADIWALERSAERLWVGTGSGVCRLDTLQQCVRYAMPEDRPSFVYALEAGIHGAVWLGGGCFG